MIAPKTKLKSLVFPKILFLVIKSKIQTKNWKKLAKNYENRISKCTILWNKLHRGRKRHWVYELSKGSCHINWFLTKNSERSKKEEINRKKSQQLTKKSRNMWQFRIWNAISGYAKYCAINFRGLHFNIASIKNYLYKKPNYKQKN